jgi:hypothetical protein
MVKKANPQQDAASEEREKQKRKCAKTIFSLLRMLERECSRKAQYDLVGEGIFMSMLRASFAKAFEYARYCNRIKPSKADEGCYFSACALRGTCEELIALQFIRRLPVRERDEVIAIEMARSLGKAVDEQAKFFEAERPFQPVIRFRTKPELVALQKDRIDEIARTTGLWTPNRGKLPPVEQMSDKVGMRPIYSYFYRITSDVVHFNPRIALRSGWGKDPRKGRFSTTNFSRYYLFYGQIYGAFLFSKFCRAFQQDLTLSKSFVNGLDAIDAQLAEVLRWPEAVTFEEMNQREPSWWLRSALKFASEQGWDKKTTAQNLAEMAKDAQEAGLLGSKQSPS